MRAPQSIRRLPCEGESANTSNPVPATPVPALLVAILTDEELAAEPVAVCISPSPTNPAPPRLDLPPRLLGPPL